MDTTPNLQLPYIAAAQAQKHVTHNEAIRALDALVGLAALDKDLAAPPGSPSAGARYIVATGATGAWAGQVGRIAAWQDGAWLFYVPREGWLCWVADEDKVYAYDGAAWGIYAGSGGGGSVNPTPLVGVNATADTTNRLSVSAPASLFSHEGSDHRLKINKSAAASTASLLFQDAFSGRAEFGLTGDDDFHVKVSADGTTWHEALVVDRSTGAVSLPLTTLTATGIGPSLLVNGDFLLNQRAFAGGALAAGSYGHDRWKADTGGANYTVGGTTVTLTSGTLVQVVENAIWAVTNLASTQVTVSVDTPSADLTITFGSASGTITAGSGRRSVTLTTAAGDTGNLAFKIAKASAGTVSFSRVKLELGASATGWQARDLASELRLCRRYYYRLGASASFSFALGFAFSTSIIEAELTHPVPMRVAPTLTVTNVGNIVAGTGGYSQALSAFGLHGGLVHSPERCHVLATLASAVASTGAGNRLQCDGTSSGLIEFSSEL